jgi:hypothetical protein
VNFIGVASMSAEYPIPRSFADALGEMVVSYAAGDWTPDGEDYCRVSIDQAAYTYESARNLIEIYDGPLPEDCWVYFWRTFISVMRA